MYSVIIQEMLLNLPLTFFSIGPFFQLKSVAVYYVKSINVCTLSVNNITVRKLLTDRCSLLKSIIFNYKN